MGMFDDLTCKYPLPDPEAQDLDFQTKDLECSLSHYEITAEGRLVRHEQDYTYTPAPEGATGLAALGTMQAVPGTERQIDVNYHGMLNFYGSADTGELLIINLKSGEDENHPGPPPEWFEYEAMFTHGTVERIRRMPNPDWRRMRMTLPEWQAARAEAEAPESPPTP